MVIQEGPGRGPRNAADQHPLFQEGEEGREFLFYYYIKFCHFFFYLLEIAGEKGRGEGGSGETFAPSIQILLDGINVPRLKADNVGL